jgi:3-methyladenine DNA glycosylase AlkC
LKELYANIPEKKRVSYGRVYTIKVLANYLYMHLTDTGDPVFKIASTLYTASEEVFSTGVALGILSYCGLVDYAPVLPFFKSAATSPDWDLREFAQMFFRKLIKEYSAEMQKFLLRLVESEDANMRRFVGETLRPVQENAWFYTDPEYSLSVLRHLFRESSPYPRTSVGNNLSDLARHLPGLIYDLVQEMVASGNKNSCWIAYRSCRNLVKKEPIKVMNLLKVDEYRYKTAKYKRSDFQK